MIVYDYIDTCTILSACVIHFKLSTIPRRMKLFLIKIKLKVKWLECLYIYDSVILFLTIFKNWDSQKMTFIVDQ